MFSSADTMPMKRPKRSLRCRDKALDRDIGLFGERQKRGLVGMGCVVDGAAHSGKAVDQQAQARVPFGGSADGRKLVQRHQRDRDLSALGSATASPSCHRARKHAALGHPGNDDAGEPFTDYGL